VVFAIIVYTPTTSEDFLMRKLTPAEREAKRQARANAVASVAPVAEAHIHTADCGHLEAPAEEAPSTEPVTKEASDEEAVADEKPKRKYTKKADAEAPSEEG
jgi:hypothetical protein